MDQFLQDINKMNSEGIGLMALGQSDSAIHVFQEALSFLALLLVGHHEQCSSSLAPVAGVQDKSKRWSPYSVSQIRFLQLPGFDGDHGCYLFNCAAAKNPQEQNPQEKGAVAVNCGLSPACEKILRGFLASTTSSPLVADERHYSALEGDFCAMILENFILLLFNLSLACHQRSQRRGGLVQECQRKRHLLEEAVRLYDTILVLLDHFPKKENKNEDEVIIVSSVLRAAVLNNKGQAYYELFVFEQSGEALDELSSELAWLSSVEDLVVGLVGEEVIEGLVNNTLCMTPPTLAGAA